MQKGGAIDGVDWMDHLITIFNHWLICLIIIFSFWFNNYNILIHLIEFKLEWMNQIAFIILNNYFWFLIEIKKLIRIIKLFNWIQT